MKLSERFLQYKHRLQTIPRKIWIIIGVGGVLLLYGVVFFIPKHVTFSYAGATCVAHFLIAPSLHGAQSDDISLTPEGVVRIGEVPLFSTQMCVEFKTSPEKGEYAATIAPFGSVVAAKPFTVTVPEAPSVQADVVLKTAISTTRPLSITLSAVDTVHAYAVKIGQKLVACEQRNGELSCNVPALELERGAEYPFELHRSFKASEQKTLIKGVIKTLLPLNQVEAGLTDGQVIYTAPTEFTFSFDQPLENAEVRLERVEGGATTQEVGITEKADGVRLIVELQKPLEREAAYRLTIVDAVAENGSSLSDPIVVDFSVSGGPKVSGVSVGAHSVAPSAAITVVLDQPMKDDIDINAFVRTEGIGSVVQKLSSTQIRVTLQGGGDCAAFKIVVDKGLPSGVNDGASKEVWSYASRILCGYSWVIGHSVKGKPIVAYSFGSGSKTILFTGGIHGSEPSGTTTMQALVQHLRAHGDIVPADRRVVIVPNTNPDGIAAGSRNNAHNVNVGRNFPTANWQANIETAGGLLVNGGGTAPGSEPEAVALITLTRQLKPRLAISYHAQGRLVGANKFADSVAIGTLYASTVGYATMFYNAEEVMGYPMTGEYEDWVGEEMNIPAILIELPTPSGNYLSSQLSAIRKMFAV